MSNASFKALGAFLLLLQIPVGYYLFRAENLSLRDVPPCPDPPPPTQLNDQDVVEYLRSKGMKQAALELSRLGKLVEDGIRPKLDLASSITPSSPPKKTKKPQMYIHIGPSKTGTTTIQLESVKWQDILHQDRYIYLGRYAPGDLRSQTKIPFLFEEDDCFQRAASKKTSFQEASCWRRRIQGLEAYRNNSYNVVLSDELYSYTKMYRERSKDFYFQLKRALGEDWNVTIVPTYRRYHEWVASSIKEMNSKSCLGNEEYMRKLNHSAWPQDGGKPCMPIWGKIRESLYDQGWRGYWLYTTLDKSIPRWREAGFPIAMLNFHQPDQHLTCAFYCEIVQNAPNTCQHCRQHAGSKTNSNSVAITSYNEIVFEAARRGILVPKPDETREDAVKRLIKYHTKVLGRKGFVDLPLSCPPEKDLKALLQKSLKYEKTIMPELYRTPHGKEEHEREFWKLANEEKVFCWVNKEALLDGKKSWGEVLEALKTTEEWPINTTTGLPT